jgi:hypothetical protein
VFADVGSDGQVRVGVTGHRALADRPQVEASVDAVLDRLLAAPGRDRIDVWSSLAEGADRLVVDRVLARPESRLVVVLPLPAEDYEADFADATSRSEFRALLARAAETHTVGPDEGGSRESAYERAGHEVVDRSEVLLALWDGEPSRGRGGTAGLIEYARDRERVLEVVLVDRPEAAA